uniref:gastrula zinc finger protein XlCGF8.2DB-like n=1 Tax=Doryrhamphus excisus TaxID=161450 RepID=UPI0025AE6534|nr:gastrula zinc finger protein XlCGF8.2DB-like [Doryrhamphus excisus]
MEDKTSRQEAALGQTPTDRHEYRIKVLSDPFVFQRRQATAPPPPPHLKEEADVTTLPLTVVSVKTEEHGEEPRAGEHATSRSPEDEEALSSDREGDTGTHGDNKHCRKKAAVKCWPCSICAESFSFKCHLTQHMLTHAGVCSEAHFDETHRTHTGEKGCTFSVCGKIFSQKRYLTVHMRTHTEEKPVSCSVCAKSYSYKRLLSQHMRRHTGEKPYSLDQGSGTFLATRAMKARYFKMCICESHIHFLNIECNVHFYVRPTVLDIMGSNYVDQAHYPTPMGCGQHTFVSSAVYNNKSNTCCH